MQEKLNNILNIIEEHFNNYVWKSTEPFKDIDFKLLLLAIKIIELKNNNIEDTNREMSELMLYMEIDFNIPLFKKDIDSWLKQNEIRHRVVINIYKMLSDLRTL
jgi:hypothetical protein